MSVKVRISTSDKEWLGRHGSDPVPGGTDARDTEYFGAVITVSAVERVKFAGHDMIRFNFGADAPRDISRLAMVPAGWVVSEDA